MSDSSLESVIGLLDVTLGPERARELVEAEAKALGLGRTFAVADAVAILRKIEQKSGPESLAAQLAFRRLKRSMNGALTTGSFPAVQADAPPGAAPASRDAARVPAEHLVSFFANSLGDDKASDIVGRAIMRLGLQGSQLTPTDASNLLDFIEAGGGVAGAIARFAKVRLLLTFRS